ncbi:MAG: MFS transporter [Ktedonobacteraceae bacterium]|nr:MFS transporter [Ktedonobacteraceae bacterium]
MPLFVEYIRQFARFQRNARLYLVCSALSSVTTGIILVLYNLYLGALGYGADFIGLALFVVALGAGLMIFPAGLCADRLSARFILIWASIFLGIVGVGQFLFRQPLPLLVSDFLAGAAGAFLLVLNAPFLTRYSTPDERSLLFSFNITVTLIATVLGELLGGFLPGWFKGNSWFMAPLPPWLSPLLAQQAEPRSYQFALLLAGIIAAPSFIPVFMMSNERPTAFSASSGERKEPVPILQSIHLTIARWRQQVDMRTVVISPLTILLLVVALISLGRGFFLPYFNLYFVKYLGASPALFGIIDGTANALTALLTLGAPWLAARVGRINAITITRMAGIPLLLAIGFTGFIPLAAILYPLRQGVTDLSTGIFQVFFMEEVPPQRRGLANSGFQVADLAGAALTTPLGGLIIAHMGYRPVFVIGAGVYIVAFATLWFRFRNVERMRTRDVEWKAHAIAPGKPR